MDPRHTNVKLIFRKLGTVFHNKVVTHVALLMTFLILFHVISVVVDGALIKDTA